MKMELDDIKRAISDGDITAISIDTSIVDGQQRWLEYGLLKRLRQFKSSSVDVVLPEVVVNEMRAHLLRDAIEAQSVLKKAMKLAKKSWRVSEADIKSVTDIIHGTDSPEAVAQRRVDDFIANIGALILKADGRVEVQELVDRYFGHIAPFAALQRLCTVKKRVAMPRCAL